MKTVNILLAGGVTDKKFKDLSVKLVEMLQSKNIEATIKTLNTYENKEISDDYKDAEIIVSIGSNKLDSCLPVVSGMSLLYPWMGTDEMISEITNIVENNN